MSNAMAFSAFSAELNALCQATRAKTTAGKMGQVLREFGSLPGVASLSDLTTTNVAIYVRFCEEKKRKPISTASLLSYLRRAATFAVKTKRLDVNPFEAWNHWIDVGPAPVNPKHHSREAIARVLAHLAAKATDWKGRRLSVLAHLVAYTGVRKTEALQLQVGDIELSRRLLRLVPRRRLKTLRAAAPVPLPEVLVPILEPWIAEQTRWVFPGATKVGPWTGGPLGSRPVEVLKAAGLECGVPGFTLLSLRHSWATHAESLWGLSELAVQRVLRHTRPRTQDHYRHVDLVNLVGLVRSIDYGPPPAA